MCRFYGDVLLVVKLNPVRIPWVDLLLHYYSAGFPNIAVFSALRHGDSARDKFLSFGARNVTVHLLDDNYGFCDHETIAFSLDAWPNFSGYMYLSDDVLFCFWKALGFPKHLIWRQNPLYKSGMTPGKREIDAVASLFQEEPSLRNVLSVRRLPYAPTSGIYYVPRWVAQGRLFQRLSAVLLRHRTYNEWGTPILLRGVQGTTEHVPLRGRLVWGRQRKQLRRMLSHEAVWYHPVRASGEAFMRVLHYVHREPELGRFTRLSTEELFLSPCLNCATHPRAQLSSKGLYHTCYRASDSLCNASMRRGHSTTLSQFFDQVTDFNAGGVKLPRRVGGNVVVPLSRRGEVNKLELPHEGFWDENVTRAVFGTYYPSLNRSCHRSRWSRPFPQCC
jgi:hypothetical protein